jgi:hypothetical protein
MAEDPRQTKPDRAFFLLLTPLTGVSLPSFLFCALNIALWLRGATGGEPVVFHVPPQSAWDAILSLQASVYEWIARWNSLATLTATAFLVFTLLRPRWRSWSGLALIPYVVLLCADFTMRWRAVIVR